MRDISSLENIHSGEDIYVIAAGKSCDFIDESFFDDRIAIGVNHVWQKFRNINYGVYKENPVPADRPDVPLVMSRYSHGHEGSNENESDYIFNHNNNLLTAIDVEGAHPNGDKLIVSYSTTTSAIHLAAFMGARAVFLVGHDCTSIDGELTFESYDKDKAHGNLEWYKGWVTEIAPQTVYMRQYLRYEYNIPLISISPFIGLKHEGHEIT